VQSGVEDKILDPQSAVVKRAIRLRGFAKRYIASPTTSSSLPLSASLKGGLWIEGGSELLQPGKQPFQAVNKPQINVLAAYSPTGTQPITALCRSKR